MVFDLVPSEKIDNPCYCTSFVIARLYFKKSASYKSDARLVPVSDTILQTYGTQELIYEIILVNIFVSINQIGHHDIKIPDPMYKTGNWGKYA